MAAKLATMTRFNDPLLPPEIWSEILTRLPVKSVLRCRSVCKSWYSLISCPNFISDHITNLHHKNGNRFLLKLLKDDESKDLLFISHDESCMESCEHHDESCMESCEHHDECPDELLGRDLAIVGSCNGLICFSEDHWELAIIKKIAYVTFLIWNPAIRKIVQLPSLSFCSQTQHASLVGFGFDSNTSDYKVMCNLHCSASKYDDCEIFDLRKGVWRSTSPIASLQVDRWPDAECYVNGAVHWSVTRNVNGVGRVMLSFNMSDESFREIRMPGCAELDDDRIRTRCRAFGGLLHVIVYKVDPVAVLVDVSESCSVWAMKEYGVTESWIQVSNIDLRSAQFLRSTGFCPHNFILWAKREILMLYLLQVDDDEEFRYKQDLVLYNTGSRKSQRIFSSTKYVLDVCLYKESLVLM